MTRALVARVVGILYLTSGRSITPEVLDAWTVALHPFSDGTDAVTVAAAVARTVRLPTVADYAQELTVFRRQHHPIAAGELVSPGRALSRQENARRMRALRDQLARARGPLTGPLRNLTRRWVTSPAGEVTPPESLVSGSPDTRPAARPSA
jgi:hypothetical protein